MNGGAGIVPIGSTAAPFTGSFDGNGKTISHLLIVQAGTDNTGLFGTVTGTLKNFALVSSYVQGAGLSGGIAGKLTGTMQNVSFQGAVNATGSGGGGLVGRLDGGGSITDSYVEGAITGPDLLGGAVGYLGTAAITRVYAAAYVDATSTTASQVGGLAGYSNGGTTADSFAFGYVNGATGATMGAAVGSNAGSMSNTLAFGAPANPSSCVGSGASTGCTVITNGGTFFNQASAPYPNWDFGQTWIWPESGRLPLLSFQNQNARVSLAPEFRAGRRISSADKAAYHLWGFCNTPTATITVTYTDSASGVFSSTTACNGGKWLATTNLSSAAQGNVSVSATQKIGSVTSSPVSLSLNKQTTLCDTGSVATFASGTGSSAAPYTICSLTQLNNVSSYLSAGLYFQLMNNLDLSAGFSGIAGNFPGNFDGNNYVLNGATAELFKGLTGASVVVTNLNMENSAVELGASPGGTVAGFIQAGATANLSNIYATGFVSTTAGSGQGGIVGGSSTTGTAAFSNVGATVVIAGSYNIGGIIGLSASTSISGSHTSGYFFGKGNIGGIGGTCSCTADNVSASAVIFGQGSLGGMVGNNSNALPIIVTNNSSVTANIYSNAQSGGVVGYNLLAATTVSHVAASGFIFASAGIAAGIVEAAAAVSLDNASFAGDLVAPGSSACGALYGPFTTTGVNLSFTGNLLAQGFAAGIVCDPRGDVSLSNSLVRGNFALVPGGIGTSSGGLVAITFHATSLTIDSSAFIGTVNGTANVAGSSTGGLVGSSSVNLTLTNNYVDAQFSNDNSLGGLVGKEQANGGTEIVKNNYVVATSSSPIAGLVNWEAAGSGSVDHNFAIIGGPGGTPGVHGTQTSSVSYANNYYSWIPGYLSFAYTGGGNTGATAIGNANAFMTASNAPMSTWDFSTKWKLPSGGGFPVLEWQ